jgi:hypothetical protein
MEADRDANIFVLESLGRHGPSHFPRVRHPEAEYVAGETLTFDRYHTVDVMYEWLHRWADRYPDIVELYQVGTSNASTTRSGPTPPLPKRRLDPRAPHATTHPNARRGFEFPIHLSCRKPPKTVTTDISADTVTLNLSGLSPIGSARIDGSTFLDRLQYQDVTDRCPIDGQWVVGQDHQIG